MPRFALLEHTEAPDDPAGRHFDLLLEADADCRTWRLAAVPEPGGPAVAAVAIAPHRRAWLDHEAGPVSGSRGFARRVDAGTFSGGLEPDGPGETAGPIVIYVAGAVLVGRLRLEPVAGGWMIRLG